MTCRRAFDADLAAVLHGEDGDAEFRAHYPACPECAAEVAVWRELDATLRAGTPSAERHPDEAELLAFVDAPAALAAGARAALERHVAGCRMCADEVRTLARTDLDRLVAASGVAAPARGRAPERSRLRRTLWHPAFAYAMVAVLLVPVLRDQLTRFTGEHAVAERRESAPELESKRQASPASAPADVAPLEDRHAAPAGALDSAAQLPSADHRVDALGKAAPPAQPKAEAASAELARERALLPKSAGKPAPVPAEEDGATRQFGATLGRAAPAAPPAAEAAPVLEIGAERPAIIALDAAARGPRLRIRVPPGGGDRSLDVHVRAASGGGEIVERLPVRADTIELQIPPRWLAAGDYVVTLGPPSAAEGRGGAAADAVVLGFTVRAPSAGAAAR